MDTSQRIRANIAATIGNLTLQQIEMQAILEDQATALKDAVAAASRPVNEPETDSLEWLASEHERHVGH